MIKTKKDGRTILSGKDYTDLRHRVFLREQGRCSDCGRWIWFASFHLHHNNGRGMGGSKRNDVDSEVTALCGSCHRKRHNQ